jgi:hypothetical protein
MKYTKEPAERSGLTTLPSNVSPELANKIIQQNFDAIWRSIMDLKDKINTLSARITNG